MDDQRLSELFRAATADPPPASFNEHDVAAAAHRVTARRRSVLLGGGGFVVVLLAVGLLLGTGLLRHTVGNASAGAGSASAPAARGPQAAPGMIQGLPGSTSMQGGGDTGKVGTHAGCGPVDGGLAVALASEIPSAGARVPVPAAVRCPAGSRSAAVAVPGGVVTAVLAPVGSVFQHPGLNTATSGDWVVLVQSTPPSAVPAGQLATAQRLLAAKY